MLGVPARLAGCARILCSPAARRPRRCRRARGARRGVERVFKLGGAQAVAAMAYGTATVPKVDKIFGPGNTWVTEAKAQVDRDPAGAARDFPAGPSEVLVIADASANAAFVASDLLSQAEHGADSQVLLLTTSIVARTPSSPSSSAEGAAAARAICARCARLERGSSSRISQRRWRSRTATRRNT